MGGSVGWRALRAAVRSFLAAAAPGGGPMAAAAARYKVVAHVTLAQRVGQGLARSAGCLWAAAGGGGGRAGVGVGGGGGGGGAGRGGPPPSLLLHTDGCGVATAENDAVGVVAHAFVLYVH